MRSRSEESCRRVMNEDYLYRTRLLHCKARVTSPRNKRFHAEKKLELKMVTGEVFDRKSMSSSALCGDAFARSTTHRLSTSLN